MNAKVRLPARLMTSEEVLRELRAQTGMEYAFTTGALVRQIDASAFGGAATAGELAAKLAPRHTMTGGVLLLEAELADAKLKALADRLASNSADERRVAAYELGNTLSTRAIAPLIAALADQDESVRHHALRSLDRLERDFAAYHPGGRRSVFEVTEGLAVDKLVDAMKSAKDVTGNEWVWAAGLVARAARPASAQAELERGARHGYSRTRETAAWALKRLASAKTPVPASSADYTGAAELITRLEKATDPEQRAELLLAIGRRGGREAWDALLARLDDRDPVVRRAAIRGLGRSSDPRVVTALVKILVAPTEAAAQPETSKEKGLPAIAASQEAEFRNLAAMSLGMIGSDQVVAELAAYLRETKKPISSVALALAWTGNPAAEAPLIECIRFKDEDEHGQTYSALRSYAYEGLSRLGTAAGLDAIITKYNEYDNTARYVGHSAVRLAGHSQAAVNRCIVLLAAGKAEIAPHGLEMAEDPRGVDALAAALPTATGERLLFTLQALGRSGDPRAVPALISALGHKEAWVRYETMRELRWRWYWSRPDVQAALAKHETFRAFVTPAPSLAEQPENTWVPRLWAADMDDYRVANTTYEAGTAFDESTGRMVKTNGHGQRCDVPQLGETWLYDPRANAWQESRSGVVPFGMCGTWGVTYDRAERKVIAMQPEGAHHGWQWERARALRPSTTWVYDGAADRWTPMQPLHAVAGPGLRGFAPLVYMDGPGRVFMHGGAWGGNVPKEMADRCWTYDTHTNTWTLLPQSKESPGHRDHQALCYLPCIDKIVLGPDKDGTTWLFDPKTNQWSDAKASGKPPRLHLPMAYDPVSKTALVFLSDGGGTVIWQYDPAANAWNKIDSPIELSPHHDSTYVSYDPANNVFIMDAGHVNWATDHIAVREVWTYRFKKASAPAPASAAPQARPEPAFPGDVVVSTLADRTVRVDWAKSASPDVAGYNIYAATVETGSRFHHKDLFKKLGAIEKLNAAPLTGTGFVDTRKLAESGGFFNHEIRAYHVKAVNKAGVESGPSATVLTLTSSVPSAAATELPDGSTRITWKPSPERNIRGYAVYRMDDFRTPLAVRLNPVPVTGTEYIDWCESPRAERRRYYVVAIDALNQEGLPSTGAWAFGHP